MIVTLNDWRAESKSEKACREAVLKQKPAAFSSKPIDGAYEIAFEKNKDGRIDLQIDKVPILSFKYNSQNMRLLFGKLYLRPFLEQPGVAIQIEINLEEQAFIVHTTNTEAPYKNNVPYTAIIDQKAVAEKTEIASNYITKHLTRALGVALGKLMQEALVYEGNEILKKVGYEAVGDGKHALRHLQNLRDTEKQIVRKDLGLPNAGQPSHWKKSELATAIMAAFDLLPTPGDKTYENVSKFLKEWYGEKAPESGESLRKMVARFKLSWKQLKTGQYS
jgi:hypothetical protein